MLARMTKKETIDSYLKKVYTRSSKLCKYLNFLNFGTFFGGNNSVEKCWKIFGGKLLVKIFVGKYSVEIWKNGRGPVDWGDLTKADRRSYACIYHQTFNMADRGSYACIYEGKINGDTIQTSTNHRII